MRPHSQAIEKQAIHPFCGAEWGSNNLTIFNSVPYFDPALENQTIAENFTLYYDVNCSDDDNDALAYYINDSSKFEINNSTGLINWTPGFYDEGIYWYNLTCGDDEFNVSQVFRVNVTNTNQPPTQDIPILNSTF